MSLKKLLKKLFILFILNAAVLPAYAQDADQLFKEGTSLIKNANYDLAVEKLEDVIKINPEHIGAHCNLGIVYAIKGDIKKGIEQIEKILDREPQPSRAMLLFNLGSMYEVRDDIKTAEFIYKDALRVIPNFAQAYMQLAQINYLHKKDDKLAKKYFYRAISIDSFMPCIPDISIINGQQVNISYTISITTKEKVKPLVYYLYNSSAWHLTLAINYMWSERFDMAHRQIDQAENALDKNSSLLSDKYAFIEVHTYRGKIYFLEKDYDKAIQEFNLARDVDQKHLGTLKALTAAYIEKKDYDEASKYCTMALDIDPIDITILRYKQTLDKLRFPDSSTTLDNPLMYMGQRVLSLPFHVAGGKTLWLPLTEGGTIPVENESFKILAASFIIDLRKENSKEALCGWFFELRTKSSQTLERVLVEEIYPSEVEKLILDDKEPILNDKSLWNATVPIEANNAQASCSWVYDDKSSIYVFRFTIQSRGEPPQVLNQPAWFSRAVKDEMRLEILRRMKKNVRVRHWGHTKN